MTVIPHVGTRAEVILVNAQRDVSVALSGGGHRATVFAVGALLALRDLGLHERIVSISSVSGGSIANGAVLVGPDFGTAPDEEVDTHFTDVVDRVARRGVLLGGAPATRWYIRFLFLSLAVTLIGTAVTIVSALVGWPWLVSAIGVLLMVAGGIASWVLFGRRSVVTERAIDRELLGDHGTTFADQANRNLSVHHVICTTEIQGGVEFYFSNRLAYGWNFGGTTKPGRIPVSTAVQASSCVPGAFRARRISLADLGLPNASGGADNRAVREIVLQDGGVYDNMADEWEYNYGGRLKSFPALQEAQPNAAASLIVVNASGGWSGLDPLESSGPRFELDSLKRAQGIQYDVSTSHRRRALFQEFRARGDRRLDGAFVQIPNNPYRRARAWAPKDGQSADPAGVRAQQAVSFLDEWGVSEDAWTEIARRCASVPTTLKPLGDNVTAELLQHGYALTLVEVYVVLGLGDLARATTRRRFHKVGAPA